MSFLLCILEVLGLSLDPEAGYALISGIVQHLQAGIATVP
jgi:hypothetical protein